MPWETDFLDTDTNLLPTPSQTVGPYFGIALPWPDGPKVVHDAALGAFWIRGRVTDGAGDPIPDALVETWQADPAGTFQTAPYDLARDFRGYGRCPTDVDGMFGIQTVMPGSVLDGAGVAQSPHIDVAVFMRGLLRPVITRIYFPDQPANDDDPLLSSLPIPDRGSLVASRSDHGFRFDIRLQGDQETAFFDL